jgi:hypothetical protein
LENNLGVQNSNQPQKEVKNNFLSSDIYLASKTIKFSVKSNKCQRYQIFLAIKRLKTAKVPLK